jgi:hypothetical protein
MAQKRPISFRIHPTLADRFQDSVGPYYGKLGACFSAALLMFLEADPKTQGEYLKRIYDAEIEDEMGDVIAAAKAEQLKKIKAREDGHKSKRSS